MQGDEHGDSVPSDQASLPDPIGPASMPTRDPSTAPNRHATLDPATAPPRAHGNDVNGTSHRGRNIAIGAAAGVVLVGGGVAAGVALAGGEKSPATAPAPGGENPGGDLTPTSVAQVDPTSGKITFAETTPPTTSQSPEVQGTLSYDSEAVKKRVEAILNPSTPESERPEVLRKILEEWANAGLDTQSMLNVLQSTPGCDVGDIKSLGKASSSWDTCRTAYSNLLSRYDDTYESALTGKTTAYVANQSGSNVKTFVDAMRQNRGHELDLKLTTYAYSPNNTAETPRTTVTIGSTPGSYEFNDHVTDNPTMMTEYKIKGQEAVEAAEASEKITLSGDLSYITSGDHLVVEGMN